jgi:hypothetical protein
MVGPSALRLIQMRPAFSGHLLTLARVPSPLLGCLSTSLAHFGSVGTHLLLGQFKTIGKMERLDTVHRIPHSMLSSQARRCFNPPRRRP